MTLPALRSGVWAAALVVLIASAWAPEQAAAEEAPVAPPRTPVVRAACPSPPPPPPPVPWRGDRAQALAAVPAPRVATHVARPVVRPCTRRGTQVDLGGYLQLWYTAIEDVENGLMQPWTGDSAAQHASGFSFRRARLSADVDAGALHGRVELGLEGTVRILDAWAAGRLLGGCVELHAGQMKVPSTYEVATASSDLDFATRSAFSKRVVDWSLCRSPSNPSPFFGVRTYLRDLGVALKGRVGALRYFVMVGNGLGANLYVGGGENKQYLFGNDFGAYFYGARASVEVTRLLGRAGRPRWLRSCEVGGHYATNDHPDAVFNDERSVLDIDRWSWSADCRLNLFGRIRLTGMVGAGAVEDDFDHDGKTDYEYDGWEVKAVATIVPGRLEVALRHDVYEEEFFENGAVASLRTTTAGVNWTPTRHLRVQLNYAWKSLDSPTDPDLHDDLLLLVAQLRF